jgi:Flp pilus assembly pilin Flp
LGKFRVNLLRSLWRDESGVQALETGLVAALITIVIVGTLRNIQLAITSTLNIISSAM